MKIVMKVLINVHLLVNEQANECLQIIWVRYRLQRVYIRLQECNVAPCSRYGDWLRVGRSGDRIQVGARFFAPVQTGPGAHPASCTTGYRVFNGVKSGRGVTLTPHPLLVLWS